MEFEERERQRRRQKLKVFIAEAGMVFSIFAIVVVATLASMGFFVSSSGTIEQSGLMQLHSFPTGATVELDGSTLFSRTNLSRSLTAGEHSIVLRRDGYDTWSKTIKMYSGMLIRLRYPRLFLLDRQQERVARLGQELEFYSPSDDNAYILYSVKSDPVWNLISVRGDEARTTRLDMSKVLPGVSEDQKFDGRIESLDWSENSDYVTVKVNVADRSEWILVNLKDPAQSLNLTQTFGLNFTQVEMTDGSASQLYALENHQLRKINTNDRTISRVLLNGVQSFANEGTNVIYVMEKTEGDEKTKTVGVYRDGEKAGTTIAVVQPDDNAYVALTKYFDEDYIAFVVNDRATVYYGAVPSYRERAEETDFSGMKILIEDVPLAAEPDSLTVSPEGEYVVARKGEQFMVIDLDMGDLYEYRAGTMALNWLDDSMMMKSEGGELVVWDFDHTNQRVLVQTKNADQDESEEKQDPSVTTLSTARVARYPAIVSENSKWIYYLVRSNEGLVLVREKIRD